MSHQRGSDLHPANERKRDLRSVVLEESHQISGEISGSHFSANTKMTSGRLREAIRSKKLIFNIQQPETESKDR